MNSKTVFQASPVNLQATYDKARRMDVKTFLKSFFCSCPVFTFKSYFATFLKISYAKSTWILLNYNHNISEQ